MAGVNKGIAKINAGVVHDLKLQSTCGYIEISGKRKCTEMEEDMRSYAG